MTQTPEEAILTREVDYRGYPIQLAHVEEGEQSWVQAWCWVERQGSLYPVTLSEKLPRGASRLQVEAAFQRLGQGMKECLDRGSARPADPTEVALSLHRHLFGDAAY